MIIRWGVLHRRALASATVVALVSACVTAIAPRQAAAAVAPTKPVYGWGFNQSDSTVAYQVTPIPYMLAAGVEPVAVSAGGGSVAFGLAIGSDGRVYSWGENLLGRLGNGEVPDDNFVSPAPIAFPGGDTVKAVSAGPASSIALGADGKVFTWGANVEGELGDGTANPSYAPEQIVLPGGESAKYVYAGGAGELATEMAAIGVDGELFAWGAGNRTSATMNPPLQPSTPTLLPMPGGAPVASVAFGLAFGIALGTDGKVFTWGGNADGELGDGTTTDRYTPAQITLPGGVAATQIVAGADNAFALGANGTLYAWGANAHGQLGDGTTDSADSPEAIALPGGAMPTSIASGGVSTYAIASDGSLYGWGYGGEGSYLSAFGDPSFDDRTSPEPITVPDGAGAAEVSAGSVVLVSSTKSGAAPQFVAAPAPPAEITAGQSYDYTSRADADPAPTYSLASGAPTWLTVNTATGEVSGTVPTTGVSTFTYSVVATNSQGSKTTDPVTVEVDALSPPSFLTADPPLVAGAGDDYATTFMAVGNPQPTYTLAADAPAWLSIDATSGAVSGTVPANVTEFHYAVTAANSQGSVTTATYTVTVGTAVTVSGTVVDVNAAPVAGAVIYACGMVSCQTTTTTAADGTYSVTSFVGDTITITAYPPPDTTTAATTASLPARAVPTGGLTGQVVALGGFEPLPSGVTLPTATDTAAGTAPVLYFGDAYPIDVTGCPDGFGFVTVVIQDSHTGDFSYTTAPLTETPPGSGTYTGSIPPTAPVYGPTQVTPRIVCPTSNTLAPSAGPASGGTPVTVSGFGFTGAKAVAFGGVPATGVSVLDDSTVQATAPAGVGTVDVTVTSADGTTTSAGRYTYQAVSSVSPAGGPTGGGTTVTLTGTGLGNAAKVLFGTAPADFTQVSDTEIQAVAPAGAGTVDVRVDTPTGETPAVAADRFTYGTGQATAGKASVTSAAPGSRGRASSLPLGTPLPPGANSAVNQLINTLVPGMLNVWNGVQLDTALQNDMKNFDCGTSKAFINALLNVQVIPLEDAFVSAALPEIIAAELAGGLAGAFLIPVTIVALNIFVQLFVNEIIDEVVDAKYSTLCDGNSFHADVLIDPSGTVVDTHGNPIAGATATLLRSDSPTGPFAPVDASGPGIEPAVNPQTTDQDGVFHWDVSPGYYEVQTSAPGCTDPDDASSPTATIGPYPVPPPRIGLVVTLACADEPPAPVPTVTGLSRAFGSAAGGDTVTVTGSGFSPTTVVAFGTTAAASVTFDSPTTLTVVTPKAAPGTVDVTATTAGGTSATSAADRFYLGSPPTVSTLSATSGPTAGGGTETITGSGFTDATLVSFGDRPATGLKVLSNTQVRVTVPAGTAGTVDVAVHNPAGASAVVAADRYTYSSGSAPAFTAQSPPSSVAAGASYAYTFAASGTPTPTYALVAGAPAWLSISSATGALRGTPPAGTTRFTYSVTATNTAGTATVGPFAVAVATSSRPPSHVDRYAGTDRFDTGLLVSRHAFPNAGTAGAVVLARGDVFADALAGIPLAEYRNGPLLLTAGGPAATALTPGVGQEISRVLGPNPGKTVFILGGVNAISPRVAAYIADTLHYKVVRLAGATRDDTALAIANDPRALNNPAHIVVARGDDFPDALAAGPYASDRDTANGVPAAILLSGNGTLDPNTAAYVSRKLSAADPHAVTAIGGGASRAVSALPAAARPGGSGLFSAIVGADRFQTAEDVAFAGWGSLNQGTANATQFGVATGFGFPDALTGGAFMALVDGPLLLTDPHDPSGLSPGARTYLVADRRTANAASVFGGTGVLPRTVSNAILQTLGAGIYNIFGNQAAL